MSWLVWVSMSLDIVYTMMLRVFVCSIARISLSDYSRLLRPIPHVLVHQLAHMMADVNTSWFWCLNHPSPEALPTACTWRLRLLSHQSKRSGPHVGVSSYVWNKKWGYLQHQRIRVPWIPCRICLVVAENDGLLSWYLWRSNSFKSAYFPQMQIETKPNHLCTLRVPRCPRCPAQISGGSEDLCPQCRPGSPRPWREQFPEKGCWKLKVEDENRRRIS